MNAEDRSMLRALIIDDDPETVEAMVELVGDEGFETDTAETLEEAREQLDAAHHDLLLVDVVLPDGSGTDLLEELDGGPERPEVVLITGHATVETAVEALRRGVADYLTKPVDVARLKTVLHNVARTRELREQIGSLSRKLRDLGHFGKLVGASEAMQEVYDLVTRVAPTDATVFVTGESGTGKELVAETLHELSKRSKGPFWPVNCGAISPNLIESELFGHEAGAFTGARRQHKGYFERASGGTIFLDEITEMPLELQVKLLRVLETGKFLRIGGEKQLDADVRVIAATNQKADKAVTDGKLREDLLYRLNVFPITLPPLRERGDDVILLANHFLAELNRAEETNKAFTPKAMDRLQEYAWPGNVRELKNVIRRAFILADSEIDPPLLSLGEGDERRARSDGKYLHVKVGSSIADVEKRLLLATLDHYEGNKKRTAETLGISLKTLYNRLKSYDES